MEVNPQDALDRQIEKNKKLFANTLKQLARIDSKRKVKAARLQGALQRYIAGIIHGIDNGYSTRNTFTFKVDEYLEGAKKEIFTEELWNSIHKDRLVEVSFSGSLVIKGREVRYEFLNGVLSKVYKQDRTVLEYVRDSKESTMTPEEFFQSSNWLSENALLKVLNTIENKAKIHLNEFLELKHEENSSYSTGYIEFYRVMHDPDAVLSFTCDMYITLKFQAREDSDLLHLKKVGKIKKIEEPTRPLSSSQEEKEELARVMADFQTP